MRKGICFVLALLVALGGYVGTHPRAQFLIGGFLVNAGYRFQDHLHAYDFLHANDINPEEVWSEFTFQNGLASSVRAYLPRSEEHPFVALLLCMDARIDSTDLVGDTRKYYYVVRTAGSVLGEAEQEMLELAVLNGVRVVVLTRHTDCAAEELAANVQKQAHFPALVAEIKERERRVAQFLARPLIASRVANGTLLVKQVLIDTATERMKDLGAVHSP